MRSLPFFCRGQVVRGFGRGSKQLGIPTANFPEQVVDNLPADVSTGIYYGWASVGSGRAPESSLPADPVVFAWVPLSSSELLALYTRRRRNPPSW